MAVGKAVRYDQCGKVDFVACEGFDWHPAAGWVHVSVAQADRREKVKDYCSAACATEFLSGSDGTVAEAAVERS